LLATTATTLLATFLAPTLRLLFLFFVAREYLEYL
jgi:hypothetical protein